MHNESRRNFIKAATYTSVLAVSGVSSLAIAAEKHINSDLAIPTEIVTLVNHTASPVTIDNISGKAIDELNDETIVTITSGGEYTFIVAAMNSKSGSANNKNLYITDVLSDGALAINSDYPEFNGIYPVSLFKIQAV